MVGLGGLEPPTSRLSAGRSNQLSYKPKINKVKTNKDKGKIKAKNKRCELRKRNTKHIRHKAIFAFI